uniref:Putative secreted protein n=1 Tax=Rhipicephalus microplus TaxID=6941 RepID=A0A6G5A070_RHIMP
MKTLSTPLFLFNIILSRSKCLRYVYPTYSSTDHTKRFRFRDNTLFQKSQVYKAGYKVIHTAIQIYGLFHICNAPQWAINTIAHIFVSSEAAPISFAKKIR